MQLRTILATLFVGSTFAAAQPGGPADPPPEPPPPEEAPAPPPAADEPPADARPAAPPEAPTPTEPAPVVTAPPGVVPPITINITNNNTGNNSNTNTQTNEQTNTQTNTAPVTVSTPVTVPTPVTVSTPVAATTNVAPLAPPSTVDQHRGRHPTIERIQMIAPKHVRAKWLAIGVTGGEGGPGVRASLDLLGRGPFTIGIAANASAPEGHHHGGGDGSASAVAYLAYTRSIGRLDVRAQIGFGISTNAGGGHDTDRGDTIARTVGGTETPATNGREHPEIAPRAEAALLVALPLTKRLGLVAGPILSATHDQGDRLGGDDEGHHDKPEVDARFMAGLRFGF